MWWIVAPNGISDGCDAAASKNRTWDTYFQRDADGRLGLGWAITQEIPSSAAHLLLRWTLRLRWVAVFGQMLAMLLAKLVFHLQLPWGALAAGLILTVLSNHFLADFRAVGNAKCRRMLNSVMVGDILILTWMLYLTGGLHNPCASFYLLLVTLAAIMVSGKALLILLVLIASCICGLYGFYMPLSGPPWVVEDGRLTYQVFILGWGISLGMAGACIAFFLHRMNIHLRDREHVLAGAERRAGEASRFQALATLAAGVAHELGSPLGTIAIASKDLEKALQRQGARPEWQEDVVLIRSEVNRCRSILDRLDRNSTKRIGESAQPTTAAMICADLEKNLSPGFYQRLVMEDATKGFPLLLSTQAVIQALVVLVENACEADTAGREVNLRIWIDDRENVVFRVLDSGPGIPNSLRHRIGEPFFTTKKDDSGMGLGIFLVQTLTSHLGGHCSLLPASNGGTCAMLSLPAHPSNVPSEP